MSDGTIEKVRERRTQEQRSRETCQRIIAGAVRVIERLGLPATSLTEIMAEAGVSRGAIQHQFASKAELISQVAYEMTESTFSSIRISRSANLSLSERVEAVLSAYWASFGAQSFSVVLEIEMHSWHDEILHQRLHEWFESASIRHDRQWVEIFGDSGLDERELISLRQITIDTLRGMALRRRNLLDRAIQEERRLLGVLLLQALSRPPVT